MFQLQKAIRNNKRVTKLCILVAVCLMTFMATLDSSIVNIALPVISRDLNTSMSQTEWVVSLYLLVICAFLLPLGRMADLIGKNRLFKIGVFLFMLGSIMCAISSNLVLVLLGRVVQAFAASLGFATNNGILTENFSSDERGKALGVLSATAAVGSIAGPSLGGLILSYLPWTYIFWINIPFGIVTILISLVCLPKDIKSTSFDFDYFGSITLVVSLVSLFLWISTGQQSGFLSIMPIILVLVGVITGIVFIIVERKKEHPLLNFAYLKNRNLSVSFVTCLLVYVANFAFNVLSPFYLENTLNLAPNIAGLAWMAFPIVQIFIAPISGILSDRINKAMLATIASVFTVISQLGFSFVDQKTSIIIFVVFVAIMGLGNGLFNTPNNAIAMEQSLKNDLGVVGSLMGFAQNMGMILGNLIVTTLLFKFMSISAGRTVLTYPTNKDTIFIFAQQNIFKIMTVMVILVFILNLMRWRTKFLFKQ